MNNGLKGAVIIGNTIFVYLAAMVSVLIDWGYKGWVIYFKEDILKCTDSYLRGIVFLLSIAILSLNIIFLVRSVKTGEDTNAVDFACFNVIIRIIQLPASCIIWMIMSEAVANVFIHYIDVVLGNNSVLQDAQLLIEYMSHNNYFELLWIDYAGIISMGILGCVMFHKLRKERKMSRGAQAACSFFSFFFGIDIAFAISGCIWYIWSES